jgi:hypothetical protein
LLTYNNNENRKEDNVALSNMRSQDRPDLHDYMSKEEASESME